MYGGGTSGDVPPSVLDGCVRHYGSVYLKLNVGKWVASVTTEPGNLS